MVILKSDIESQSTQNHHNTTFREFKTLFLHTSHTWQQWNPHELLSAQKSFNDDIILL